MRGFATFKAAFKRCSVLTQENIIGNSDRSKPPSHFKISLIATIPLSMLASTSPRSRISSVCSTKDGSMTSSPNSSYAASLQASAINSLPTQKMPILGSVSVNFGNGQMTRSDKLLWNNNGQSQTESLINLHSKEKPLKRY